MAAPVVESRATSTPSSSPYTVALPAGVASGDLVVIVGMFEGADQGFSVPSPWVELADLHDVDPENFYAAYLEASGGETSVDVTGDGSDTKGAFVALRISGAEDPDTQAPEIESDPANVGDPPSITPTGGSKDYLFVVAATSESGSRTIDAAPDDYSDFTQIENEGIGSTEVATAERQLTTSSENPGAFTYSSAGDVGWGVVIAIHPAGADADPLALDALDASPTFGAPELAGAVAPAHLDASPSFGTLTVEEPAGNTITLAHLDASPSFGVLTVEAVEPDVLAIDHLDASPTFGTLIVTPPIDHTPGRTSIDVDRSDTTVELNPSLTSVALDPSGTHAPVDNTDLTA